MEDGPSFFKKAINGVPPRSRGHCERYCWADPTWRRRPPLEIAIKPRNPGGRPEKQIAEELGLMEGGPSFFLKALSAEPREV